MTITFFTTFNDHGFTLYGKQWLTTFLRNVDRDNPNIHVRVYTENVDTPFVHNRIEFLDFNESIPEHSVWKQQFSIENSITDQLIRLETVRFSHKAFAIQHALNSIKTDYAIWLDGDCVFHKESYNGFIESIMGNNFLACQLEENNSDDSGNHIESGILIFDMNHDDTKRFVEQFSINYKIENLSSLNKPFDGYIINKTLSQLDVKYTNLNSGFGMPGIQGETEHTFLHPEISKRFTHNIGATGKASYKNWNEVKYKNDAFNNLNNHLRLIGHKSSLVNERKR